MPSPFPGMDPYLEHPDLWPDAHNGLIAAIRDVLAPSLRPHYYVALEERTYLEDPPDLVLVGRPDLAVVGTRRGNGETSAQPGRGATAIEVEVPMSDPVRETYLEVRSVGEGDVVTVIELLSPSNKRAGAGRRLYLDKRQTVLATRTHLVEIDLLRGGERMPTIGPPVVSDYRILVSRSRRRPRAELLPFGLRDPVPAFPVPLRPVDEEPSVGLGGLLAALYDRASYDLRIDYRRPPEPPVGEADAAWAAALIERGKPGQ